MIKFRRFDVFWRRWEIAHPLFVHLFCALRGMGTVTCILFLLCIVSVAALFLLMDFLVKEIATGVHRPEWIMNECHARFTFSQSDHFFIAVNSEMSDAGYTLHNALECIRILQDKLPLDEGELSWQIKFGNQFFRESIFCAFFFKLIMKWANSRTPCVARLFNLLKSVDDFELHFRIV